MERLTTFHARFYDHAAFKLDGATSTTRWSSPRPTRRRTSSTRSRDDAARARREAPVHCLLHVAP